MVKTPQAPITIAGDEIEGLVDTGFEGGVAVPVGFLEAHSLEGGTGGDMRVAGGELKPCWIAVTTVEWLGAPREIDIAEWEDEEILIGMNLLDGTRIDLNGPAVKIRRMRK